jgi:hypothetical protein
LHQKLKFNRLQIVQASFSNQSMFANLNALCLIKSNEFMRLKRNRLIKVFDIQQYVQKIINFVKSSKRGLAK